MRRVARPTPRTPLALLVALATLSSCHGAGKSTQAEGIALPTGMATLAAFDPAGVGPGEPPRPGPSRPLDVIDYGPQGRTEGNGEIHVRFNQPVVALDLADSTGLEKLFTTEPPLPGRAYWKTPDLLVFAPTNDLLDCHSYTVRFTGGLVGLDGQRFDRALGWSFETRRPTVAASDPMSRPRHQDTPDIDDADEGEVQRRDSVVLVRFDRPVALKAAQAHIRATARPLADLAADAKPVPVRVRRPTKAERERIYYGDDDRHVYAVQARTLWPGSSEVEVSVTTGMVSEAGPLPLDTPWSMVFRTYSQQALLAVDCPPDAPCGLQPISLRLRNPVSAQQFRKITISPKPRYFAITDFNDWGDGGREATLAGQFVPGTTYTVHVPAGMRDIYGQSIPGGATRQAVIAPRATLALSSASGILPPSHKQTVGVESRHVKSLHVRAGVFTDAEVAAIDPNFDASTASFPARVIERDIPLTVSGKGDWSSVALDLDDLAGGARRPVLLEVSAADLVPRADEYGPPTPVRGLFRLTDLGPVAIVSLPASSVQVLRLSSGAPVPKARVSRFDPRQPGKLLDLGTTDANGLLALPAELVLLEIDRPRGSASKPVKPPPPLRLTVIDSTTDDHAHLDLAPASLYRNYRDDEPTDAPPALRPGERLIARVVSERGVYRPGEKVRVVGWSALDTPFSRSNLGRVKTGTPVVFTLLDDFDKEVATHATHTTTEGKFWAELVVPAEAGLGRYTVHAKLLGQDIQASVKVEDYRVPEYTVDAVARRGDILAGEQTTIDVHASYYFGGPVQIQRLTRATRCEYQRYRPPGLEDIWDVGEPSPSRNYRPWPVRVVEATPAVTTPAVNNPAVNNPGRRVVLDGGPLDDLRHPHRCITSLEVQDASMQGIGAEAGFAVHPAAFYLALAAPRGYLEAEQRVRVPMRAVDIQGERVAVGAVTLEVHRHWNERSFKPEGGKQVFAGWVERSARVTTCKHDLAAAGPDPTCALPVLVEGRYELSVTASEPASTRAAHSSTSFQVHAKSPPLDTSWRSRPIDRLEVLTDRQQLKPGETVEVAVRSPWPDAHGTLVVARGGIRETLPIALAGKEQLFKFTADDTWTPSVVFQATIVEPAATGGSFHPRVHEASATVHQSQDHRRLQVVVTAPPRAGPGQQVELNVRVRDEQDRPTVARVALWAVDEAVLDLTQHEIPDLLPDFIPHRTAETRELDDYRQLLHPYTATPHDPWFTAGGSGFGHGSGSGSSSSSGRGGLGSSSPGGPPPARSRFETTPVFLADLAVDRTGEATVKATLPDNLTTFRITAVASARLVDGTSPGRFGKHDTRTVVTAPLVVRAALPRTLRPGDRAELAAIVQNNTGAAGRLSVTARVVEKPGTKGHVLKLLSSATASAEVTPGDQTRLTFQIEAVAPGAPEFELQAALEPAGGGAKIEDGLRLPLPVEAERTLTERVAAYGTVTDDQAVAIPIKLPTDVLRGHGGVTVATTSTLLGGLEDAVHALVQYPYGCIEQTASRLLPIVALGALKDYPLGVADTGEFMKVGVERILAMQTDDGGFGYWPGSKQHHVYASAYATWVLHLADKAGHPVPKDPLERALKFLTGQIDGLVLTQLPVDWGYHDGVRVAIALHVLADAGRDVKKQAANLYTLRQQLPLFARAFLLMAMHRHDPHSPEVRTLQSELLGNLQELPATAHTSEASLYALDEFFASDGRSDAITLMALLRIQPDHPVIVKLARGLLERRIGGAWRNTQENAYALVALADYARIYEAELPDFTARAWVGRTNVLDEQFKGRELATRSSFTDMATILDLPREPGAALLPVVLQRRGQGRLYYRLAAEWAPAQTDLPARNQGFVVTRDLRTVSGAATTTVPAGEPIAMDITISSKIRVRYVVIDVPLPAGLEGVSRTLGVGRSASVLAGHRGWWVSHEEQRPDRVVVFADDLPPGTHTHTIDLRSTSRGQFSFPPARAEAMYMPEVHGRTVGARLEVR